MEKIYEVEGILNKGFIGNISYNICLDKEYEAIDVEFSFDKQKVDELTNEIIKDLNEYANMEYNREFTEEELVQASKHMKTEIQTALFLNNEFAGGIHNQLIKRNMYISSEKCSEGCLPQENINGVLKVNIMVFNIIYNNTHYTLRLKGKSKENNHV